jgi:hypothetical protein
LDYIFWKQWSSPSKIVISVPTCSIMSQN